MTRTEADCVLAMGVEDRARFWVKARRESSGRKCWLWSGAVALGGYGTVRVRDDSRIQRSRTVSVHRVAWILTNGAIPDGLQLLHSCDVKVCCNPDHLLPGTAKDNTDDAVRKGRRANPNAALINRRRALLKELQAIDAILLTSRLRDYRTERGVTSVSSRQAQVLVAIADGLSRGAAPTIRELCVILGNTTNAASGHVIALERRGLVSRVPGVARNLRITPEGERLLSEMQAGAA